MHTDGFRIGIPCFNCRSRPLSPCGQTHRQAGRQAGRQRQGDARKRGEGRATHLTIRKTDICAGVTRIADLAALFPTFPAHCLPLAGGTQRPGPAATAGRAGRGTRRHNNHRLNAPTQPRQIMCGESQNVTTRLKITVHGGRRVLNAGSPARRDFNVLTFCVVNPNPTQVYTNLNKLNACFNAVYYIFLFHEWSWSNSHDVISF